MKAQAPKGLACKPLRVHVIGAGDMGADIAGWCVASGMEVTLQDVSAPSRSRRASRRRSKLFARKFKTKAAARRGEGAPDRRSQAATDIGRADVVIEAIVEKLEVKQKPVQARSRASSSPARCWRPTRPRCMIEDIAAAAAPIPGRLIGIHFFNPVAQMPLVEVVRGAQSREDEVKRGAAFVTAIDKFPLITKSVPGLPRQPRAHALHDRRHAAAGARRGQGEASTKRRARSACRWGPSSWPTPSGSTCARTWQHPQVRFRRVRKLDRLVAAGKLGKKTGEGFYVWKDGKPRSRAAPSTRRSMERLGRELVDADDRRGAALPRRARRRERRPRRRAA